MNIHTNFTTLETVLLVFAGALLIGFVISSTVPYSESLYIGYMILALAFLVSSTILISGVLISSSLRTSSTQSDQ